MFGGGATNTPAEQNPLVEDLMNTQKTGIIYHVIDKENEKIVKVGCTTMTLDKRWAAYDHKKYCFHYPRGA